MKKFSYVGKLFIASVAMIMSFNGCICSASVIPEFFLGCTFYRGNCRFEITDSGLTMVDATNLSPLGSGRYVVYDYTGDPRVESTNPRIAHMVTVAAIHPHAFDGFNQRFIDAGENPPIVEIPSNLMPEPDAGWTFPQNVVGC